MPFLRFFYDTFPAVDDGSAGAAVVVEPESAGGNSVNDSANDSGASSDVHPEFPSLRMPIAVIYKYFTVISDKLIDMGQSTGKFSTLWQCTTFTTKDSDYLCTTVTTARKVLRDKLNARVFHGIADLRPSRV
jgi:hypothetical protein